MDVKLNHPHPSTLAKNGQLDDCHASNVDLSNCHRAMPCASRARARGHKTHTERDGALWGAYLSQELS